jgi:hypothetical protein
MGNRMLPDLRFVIGAALATALLVVIPPSASL